MVFIREKKIDCAEYREVDIIPRTEAAEQASRGKRGKKRKVNAPKQKDLNDKNAKRYLVQLGNGNRKHCDKLPAENSIPQKEAGARTP